MKRFYSVMLALLLIFSLCACGASSGMKMEMAADQAAPAEPMAFAANTSAGGFAVTEEAAEAEYSRASDEDGAAADNSQDVDPDKIIYSADATLETTDFDAAISGIIALVEEYDGWVESSSINGANYYSISRGNSYNRSANYVLRIPGENFQTMMNSLSTLGNVPYTHIYTENVTAQYYDTQARLTAYEAQEQRLVEMMEIAETVEEIVILEDKLTDLRYRIDSLQSSLNNWDRRVNYSTLYLNIEEVREYTPDSGQQLSYGQELWLTFTDSIEGVGDFFKDALVFLVSIIPAVVIILVLLLILRPLLKKSGARCKARREKKAEDRLLKKCRNKGDMNCYEMPEEKSEE